ncbi:MAG: 4-hydroxybenzoate 3-monooxygenase [Alphaproteobacteria bacterium]
MRTQVAIIGSGPAGLLLGERLAQAGVDAVILEKQDRDYVLGRIRAGVLEDGTVAQLHELGLGERVMANGLVHEGLDIAYDGKRHRLDLTALTGGKRVTVYGQTEVTRDLMDARERAGRTTIYDAADVTPLDFDHERPRVQYSTGGATQEIQADFIVGADGYHGVSRASIPAKAIQNFERNYPFAWLGLLADVKPVSKELIYVNHPRGFALCSMRSPTRSRYYLQMPSGTDAGNWTPDLFFDELRRRLDPATADMVETGPALELGLAPLRSFVAEPLRFGRLFLAGDAGHIVPPTGAKGLNLAASDAYYLSEAITEFYDEGSSDGIDAYSARALARVWRSVRFSAHMTALTHLDPTASDFDRRVQRANLDALTSSKPEAQALAESYVGTPY